MKISRHAGTALALLVSSALALNGQVRVVAPMPAEVVAHVNATGAVQVPNTLFGAFLEPIGGSINGGLAAEILVNRSLESGLWGHAELEGLFQDQPELIESSNRSGIPIPWLTLNKNAGNRFELHVGSAANSWQSLEIMGQPEELTGIRQKVYLPVQRVLRYNVSVYAKHLSGPSALTFEFRDRETGSVLAHSSIKAAAAQWTKYKAELVLPKGAVHRLQAVDFSLSVEGNERVEVDQFSLMPADALGTLDPDAVGMIREMHPTELRFGGNFSSYYHWRDGIGPEDKRVSMKNIAWGISEYNNFGTDEFLELCKLVSAMPQFNLNMGSGTPEEATEWVRYIKAHYTGKVLYEIGNELYGNWQIGYPTLREIAARTEDFSKAVHAADPDAYVIATGKGPMNGEAWNDEQLRHTESQFDALSLHFILDTNHPVLEPAKPDFIAAAAYALPWAVSPYFDQVHAKLNSFPQRRNVQLAVTEWLFNSKGYGEPNLTNESPCWMNQGGAVMAGGFFNTLLRQADTTIIADMTGAMEFGGVWRRRGQVYAVPAYYVFQMYSAVKGDTVLSVSTNSGAYALQGGISPLDRVDSVPWIDVVATRNSDGKFVTLLNVNRSLEKDVQVRFKLDHMHVAGAAQMKQMRASNRYEHNDEVEPNRLLPQASEVRAGADGDLVVVLPRESVSVIKVPVE